MRVGVHNESTESRTRFPLSKVERRFTRDPISAQNLITRFQAKCQDDLDAGLSVVWSFKPLPVDVGNGAWEPYVRQFARYLRDNQLTNRVVVVIWHEPENDVPKYFKSGSDFVAVFNTVHDWLVDVDSSIVTSHAALGYAYRNLEVTPRAWVTKATIHSIDLYSGKSFPLSMTLKDSTAFKRWKASRPIGSKWAVAERGWIADASKSVERVKAIDAESDYLASLPPAEQPELYCVWNTVGTDGNPDIPLDEAGIEAVNRMFARVTQLVCPLCFGAGNVTAGKIYVIVRG